MVVVVVVVVVESGGVEREEGLPQLSNCEHRGGWGVQILVIL